MRDPDVERTCCAVPGACRLEMEFERFIADEGIGIADTL